MSNETYTEDQIRDIFFGDHEDFGDEPVLTIDDGERRWNHDWTKVYKHKDGSYWAVPGSLGATEMQEHEFNWQPYKVEAREESTPPMRVLAFYDGDNKVGQTKGEPVDAVMISRELFDEMAKTVRWYESGNANSAVVGCVSSMSRVFIEQHGDPREVKLTTKPE